ncbi:hypothetical protein [Sphingomonas hankookensis]|uniref:hypothetical protein n=1 Tax=Sphingomonas hankookensis TaxID=563996 RepID=UPI003D302622
MTSRVREALRRGRRDLHREMSVPALYIPVPNATPIPLTVRPQDLPGANGKPGGGDQGYAQVADLKPKLVFLAEQVPAPLRPKTGVVSVESGEAYRIEFVHPAHGVTITADVVRLSAAEAAGLPLPVDLTVSPPVVRTPVGVLDLSGGATGDVLRKHSDGDYDLMWVPGSFTFEQAEPRMSWTIPHNMGRIPVIAVVGTDGHEIEAEVIHSVPDYNTTTLNFLEAVAGAARLS